MQHRVQGAFGPVDPWTDVQLNVWFEHPAKGVTLRHTLSGRNVLNSNIGFPEYSRRRANVNELPYGADAGVFYDYESKYADGGSRHIIPARVHPDMYDRALDIALAAHRALGCRGATRCDFRYDDTSGEPGRLVLLEINTQPGLTPTSLLPEQAAHHGMNFSQLCAWMVENATCRA